MIFIPDFEFTYNKTCSKSDLALNYSMPVNQISVSNSNCSILILINYKKPKIRFIL
jgi:hypothetical protein